MNIDALCKKERSINFKDILRLLFGFVAGTASYVFGFVIGGIAMTILLKISLLPPIIDTFQASLTASAITANPLALFIFSLIDKNKAHNIAFAVWLIILAAIYFVISVFGRDFNLLWYPILSVIINGMEIRAFIKQK